MSPNYELIKRAILEEKQVVFMYQGLRREACPHVLGRKHGLEKVLFFQFGGQSNSGLPVGGMWRCVFLSEVHGIELVDGEWHSRDSHKQPQSCVDDVHVEMRGDSRVGYTPYLKRAYS
ncbi:MAG: hypothetical protein Q7T23_18435 [Phenylobacterium sp.]|nr:hypothetical protein [Phenylobacterium sp.]